MEQSFKKIIQGYQRFRNKYATGSQSMMEALAKHGQKPEIMVIACSDSRVDPAVILQSEPGELFTVRNVANIIPPYEIDNAHHGTSAALEFAVCYLKVKHIIILGHSQCGGIHALQQEEDLTQNDFITRWVSLNQMEIKTCDTDTLAKHSLAQSYQNCSTFPWIKDRIEQKTLAIHQWFFDIKQGKVFVYSEKNNNYLALTTNVV